MKFVKTAWFVLILFLIGVVLAIPARADEWNKKTVVTFNEIVEIPGRLLPAGTYVFKLADSQGYRHIVQVWNKDETEVLATILAIPDYRLEPTGETVIQFHESPGIGPQALRAWFYPGDNFGHEFVYYPKTLALLLAQLSNVVVPAETIEPTKENLKSVPLVAVTPGQKEEPIAEAIQTTPFPERAASAPAMVAERKALPKTASPVPLVGLLGLVSLGLAFGLRLLIERTS
jgi:hypothetical protein